MSLESAARRLCKAQCVEPCQHCLQTVRVVLIEIRSPTKKQTHAAAKAMSPGKRPTPDRISNRAKHAHRWRCMIDALLEEPME